jgi:hypothetical protein
MFSSLILLAAEANGVVALRMMKLMRGGRSARLEANLMVSEKISAAFQDPHAHSCHRDDGLLRTHPTPRQCTQSTFKTFAFVVSPVISLRRFWRSRWYGR